MSTNKASIYYDIITEYNGKGAKTAATSFGNLDSVGKKLAKTLAGVFSVVAIEQFGKASIDAFAKEDAAIKVLSNTLGNLGLAFDTPQVTSFITKLAESTGVMKEQLFPAFETLVRYTNDTKKAQDLLSLSLDISAGTGKDASAVALALGKAYGGNTAALGRLGAGLTKAELSSKNFGLVQNRLTALFKGDAAAAADSYQGKINRLKVAFEELKVNVGMGLTEAFSNITGDQGITGAINAMNEFGLVAGQTIANLSSGLSSSGIAGFFGGIIKDFIVGLNVLSGHAKTWDDLLLDAQKAKERKNTEDLKTYYANLEKSNAIILANKKQQEALDRKALQAAKDKAALDKASAALKLAGTVFDMSQIEIVAALQRNVTDDQKTRLELQLALLNGNADAASKLTQKLLETQIEALQVEKANPFFAWTDALQAALQALIDLQTQMAKFAPIVPLSPAAQSAITLGQDAAASIADLSGLNSTDLASLGLSPDATYGATADALAKAIAENGAGIAGLNTSAGMNGASSTANPYSWFNNSSAYNPVNGNVNVTVMLDSNQVTSYVNSVNQNSTVGGTQLTTSRINQQAIG